MLTKAIVNRALVVFVLSPLGLLANDEPSRSSPDTSIPSVEITRDIVYSQPEKKALHLDIYVPSANGVYPAVMLVHGGGWSLGSKLQIAHHGVRLAKMGYVAVSIDYRKAPAHKFPAQIEDCRAALIWMRKNAKKFRLDPTRIGAAGYSAGAHLVCLLAAQGQKPKAGEMDLRLSAVVAGGAPCDFQSIPADSTKLAYWLGGTRSQKAKIYRDASPLAFCHPDMPPFYFYNGTKDSVVPITWTEPMVKRLKRIGVEVEWHKVEGGGHFTTFLNKNAIDKACEFLGKHLKRQERNPKGESRN